MSGSKIGLRSRFRASLGMNWALLTWDNQIMNQYHAGNNRNLNYKVAPAIPWCINGNACPFIEHEWLFQRFVRVDHMYP